MVTKRAAQTEGENQDEFSKALRGILHHGADGLAGGRSVLWAAPHSPTFAPANFPALFDLAGLQQ